MCNACNVQAYKEKKKWQNTSFLINWMAKYILTKVKMIFLINCYFNSTVVYYIINTKKEKKKKDAYPKRSKSLPL